MKLYTLLCCINPTGSMDDIDEFTFYQMVNPIVPVLNIKIFDKTSQVKAFVQIEGEELAEAVIKDLHGKQMNIGKIKVFVSHKKFVAFDKSLPEILSQANRSSLDYMPPSQYASQKALLGCNPYFSNSVTGFKSKIQAYSSWKVNTKPAPLVAPNISDKVLCGKQPSQEYDVSPSIYVKKKLAQFTESEANLARIEQKISPIEPKISSACIKIANIDMKVVSCQMLFNVFGCFGNASRLLIQENAGFAILEYQNKKAVDVAIKYTDCIKFCGKTLSVTAYSGPDLFDQQSSDNTSKSAVYTNHVSNYKFTDGSANVVVPPSRTLRFSNLPRTASVSSVKTFVAKIHMPLTVNPERTKDQQHGCFTVEFKFLYEAFKVLSMLNDALYEESKLSVSFHKRKVEA